MWVISCVNDYVFLLCAGKQRHIKLLHTSALEGYEVDPVKIQETKGCQMFSTNSGQNANASYICVAIKRTVMAFELTNLRQKYRKLRDIPVAGQVQFMSVWGSRLCVGYQSNFVIYDLLSSDGAPVSLVNPEDSQLKFLSHSSPSVDSMLAVEVSEKEFLLAFSCKYSLDFNERCPTVILHYYFMGCLSTVIINLLKYKFSLKVVSR